MTNVIGSIGERLDLLIRQGGTFGKFNVVLQNPDGSFVDLTGSVIRAKLKKNALDAPTVYDFNISMVDPVNGEFEFWLTDEQTAALPAGDSINSPQSKYVWDLEIEDVQGAVLPVYYGNAKVFREVTA